MRAFIGSAILMFAFATPALAAGSDESDTIDGYEEVYETEAADDTFFDGDFAEDMDRQTMAWAEPED